MKDTYIFPAILDYEDDGISVEFPDLPGCLSCADSTEEAISNAKEALGLYLWDMEKEETIPDPTPVEKLKLEHNQIPILIEVYMPLVRNEMNNKSVKKTLTIPYWLNKLAEDNQVNFSQILQVSLKEYLGIEQRNH